MHESLILTAASQAYADAVIALIGSAKANWPDHPEIRVYDLGMDAVTAARIGQFRKVTLVRVPEFCPHWRQHYVWRTWCVNEAPCARYLWLDAGAAVLRPMGHCFETIAKTGYFCVTTWWALRPQVNDHLRRYFSASNEWLESNCGISGGVHGLEKNDAGKHLLQEFYDISLDEKQFQATEPTHRHDQAVLSLLFYKHFGVPVCGDHPTYCGTHLGFPGQCVWIHRRSMVEADLQYFHSCAPDGGVKRLPQMPVVRAPGMLMKVRRAIAKFRGREPRFISNGISD